jgi:hypothetical protein
VGRSAPPDRERENRMQLDHIFVRLDLDRWTLTCQFTMELICRNATRAEAEEALDRHRCGWHQEPHPPPRR